MINNLATDCSFLLKFCTELPYCKVIGQGLSAKTMLDSQIIAPV